MILKRSRPPVKKILVLPISHFGKTTPEFNEAFLRDVLRDNPGIGKEAETHFIINTGLTLQVAQQMKQVYIFNVLLRQAAMVGHGAVQLTKN